MLRKTRIETILTQTLKPVFLQVENESGNHHVPKGSETHFKVVLVTQEFAGKTRVARHRVVNALLKTELDTGLHALSMHLFTEEEWAIRKQEVMGSPKCRDGFYE